MASLKRVLIADDYAPYAQVCSYVLASHFDVVGVAKDGDDLVRQARLLHPDVIVADINMPRVSGVEAARTLLDERPDLQVVFMTATAPEDLDVARELGRPVPIVRKGHGADLLRALDQGSPPAQRWLEAS